MKTARMRIVKLASGQECGLEGQYVKEYDPSRAPDDPDSPFTCHLVLTEAYDDALSRPFADMWNLYNQVDSREPVRPDGFPNKPLTAFMVEFRK